MYPVSITSQGQISIPADLRRSRGFEKGKKVLIYSDGDELRIRPVKDFMELAGTFKTNKKPLTNDQLHNVVAKAMAQEALK